MSKRTESSSEVLRHIVDHPRDFSSALVAQAREDLAQLERFRLRIRRVFQGKSDEPVLVTG